MTSDSIKQFTRALAESELIDPTIKRLTVAVAVQAFKATRDQRTDARHRQTALAVLIDVHGLKGLWPAAKVPTALETKISRAPLATNEMPAYMLLSMKEAGRQVCYHAMRVSKNIDTDRDGTVSLIERHQSQHCLAIGLHGAEPSCLSMKREQALRACRELWSPLPAIYFFTGQSLLQVERLEIRVFAGNKIETFALGTIDGMKSEYRLN